MDAALAAGATLLLGEVQGVTTETVNGMPQISGVKVDGNIVEADCAVVCMGPWSNLASKWFGVPFPITGVKSTSVTFDTGKELPPFALFCAEDDRFGTHLEVYPRKSGHVYVVRRAYMRAELRAEAVQCGVGGSQHVTPEQLAGGQYPPAEVR